jgi:plasmid stability protein
MQSSYTAAMKTTVVQVRDVPEGVVATLKARAEARGQSLAAYLRDLLADEAARPSIDEVMANIAARAPVNYTVDDVRSLIEDGRR